MSTGSIASFSSRPDRVGREGFLDLRFERRGGQTILARRRWTHPLQALEPVRAQDGSLCLMLLNTSGGLVGGDELRCEIELGEHSAAVLLTASAARVYRTLGPAARQSTTIRVQTGATLEYLPDHLIPHPGAIYHQSLLVEMAPRSRAIICDAMAAGRVGRGERWQFHELRSEILVRRASHPIYLSRSRIVPHELSIARLAVAEDFNYIATLLVTDDMGRDWGALADDLDLVIQATPAMRGAVTEIAGGGCLVRAMAHSATDLRRLLHELWGVSRRRLLNLGPFDTRKM